MGLRIHWILQRTLEAKLTALNCCKSYLKMGLHLRAADNARDKRIRTKKRNRQYVDGA